MLRWIDGFESYDTTNGNTTSIITGKYTSSGGTITVRAGRLGGHGISLSGSQTLRTPVFTANDTWIVGFGFYYTHIASEQQIMLFKDGTTNQCSLYLTINGELRFYRGDQGSNLGTSTGARIRAGVWNYIEVKVKINTTTGTVDIKVNNASVLSLTSKNTDSASTSQATNIALGTSTSGSDIFTFDDFYVCDKSGSNNNTFLTPQKVTTLLPTGDNGTNQYTPSSGANHYDRVNETPPNGNTTYVSDSTSGHIEEWNYADTGSEVTSIKGVQVNTVFETDSASAFSIKNHINSGGTSSDDAGTAGVNGTYNTPAFLAELDPNTSALWTKTNLDAALFGVKTV